MRRDLLETGELCRAEIVEARHLGLLVGEHLVDALRHRLDDARGDEREARELRLVLVLVHEVGGAPRRTPDGAEAPAAMLEHVGDAARRVGGAEDGETDVVETILDLTDAIGSDLLPRTGERAHPFSPGTRDGGHGIGDELVVVRGTQQACASQNPGADQHPAQHPGHYARPPFLGSGLEPEPRAAARMHGAATPGPGVLHEVGASAEIGDEGGCDTALRGELGRHPRGLGTAHDMSRDLLAALHEMEVHLDVEALVGRQLLTVVRLVHGLRLEVVERHGRHAAENLGVGVVLEVACLGLGSCGEAEHELLLVELLELRSLELRDHEDDVGLGVGPHVDVEFVTVGALGAANVAVVGVHAPRPFLAVGTDAGTRRTLGVLDGDGETEGHGRSLAHREETRNRPISRRRRTPMSNTVSNQKIRNAITRLAPSIKDHDAVLRGYVTRVRASMSADTEAAFEYAMAGLAGEILGLETQLKAANAGRFSPIRK